MAEPDEREGLAAEFVLGTLAASERLEAARLLATEASFAALVAAWERRLVPLALALEPAAPPGHVRDRVMQAIPDSIPGSAEVLALARRARRWQGLALAAGALAAVLALFIVLRPALAPQAGRYVAVLQAEGTEPAFLASIDIAGGTIRVRTIAARPQPGKSYELWAVGAGRAKPQSLGVIDAAFRVPADRLGRVDAKTLGETVFAVSLEPEGGSPTGEVTGPVLFVGKLVAAE
ncbi:MAG: anti-sigma factor [Hyphomicrobiales bacterium]